MSAINTLKGHFIKDYSVVYKEKLTNGLWFYVICRYDEGWDSKDFYKSSSEIYIDAIITDGSLTTYGNNVVSYREIDEHEDILRDNKFKEIEPEITTKHGYRVWQQEFNKKEYSREVSKNKFEKRKHRNLKWLVSVPKNDLLKFALK